VSTSISLEPAKNGVAAVRGVLRAAAPDATNSASPQSAQPATQRQGGHGEVADPDRLVVEKTKPLAYPA
jgi:hypothetical protein